ncbi:hypothetical protein [Acidisoma sp. 7E03]
MSNQELLRLRAQVEEATARMRAMQQPLSAADREQMEAVRHRHDAVAALFGERAREPMAGESPDTYRAALLQDLAKRTRSYAKSNFFRADSATLAAVEPHVLAEARHDALSSQRGRLVEYHETDPSGRRITKYAGDIGAFMAPFMAPPATTPIRNPREGNR